jgi:oxalate decarboxylase
MHSSHTFDIKSIKPQTICNGGSRTIVNSDNFPILRGMATYSLLLKKGGVREPHWHPNAAELSYCLSGKAFMTIFGSYSNEVLGAVFDVDPKIFT